MVLGDTVSMKKWPIHEKRVFAFATIPAEPLNLNLVVSGFYKEETQYANTVPLKGDIRDVPEIHQFYEFDVGNIQQVAGYNTPT
jgi:hypothetical protein